MKYLFKNIALFAVLSVVLSSFAACTKTTDSALKSMGDNSGGGGGDTTNSDSAKNDDGKYAPAPTAIMQADIKDIDGNSFKLADKKGKIVLINLWAIYCTWCIKEMPELVALQDRHTDKNFEIIGLDIEESDTPEAIKAFAQKLKLNYQLGYADSKLTGDFLNKSKFPGIPQSFLIDREGNLRNVFIGGDAANVSKIKEAVEKVIGDS